MNKPTVLNISPAPWRVKTDLISPKGEFVGHTVRDADDWVIVHTMASTGVAAQRVLDDFRLIAAAPELFSALQALVTEFEEHASYLAGELTSTTEPPVLAKAKKALAFAGSTASNILD